MYQAAVTSGAVTLSGFGTWAPVARPNALPAWAVCGQVVPLSKPHILAEPGNHISVSGVSMDTEKAPNRPQPASGCVHRNCGTREWPGLPTIPENEMISGSASGSAKFEFA